jgi:hypothetical protein
VGALLDGFHALEEVQDAGSFKGIEDLLTALVIDHNAGISEQGEVFGDGGHVQAGGLGEFADALGFARQLFDKEQAGGMGKGFQDLRLGFQTGFGLGGHDVMRLVMLV